MKVLPAKFEVFHDVYLTRFFVQFRHEFETLCSDKELVVLDSDKRQAFARAFFEGLVYKLNQMQDQLLGNCRVALLLILLPNLFFRGEGISKMQ